MSVGAAICRVAAAGAILGVLASMAMAQGVYRWKDDKGRIHFSDVPPAGRHVERMALGAPPAASASHAAEAAAKVAVPNAASVVALPGEGVARLVVVSRRSDRPEPAAIHIVGVVGNFGKATARDVAMVVTALDKRRQTQCVHKRVSVTPPTLPPGGRGKFEARIEAPCLEDSSSFDAAPVWR